MLKIKNLRISIEDKPILKGLDLTVGDNEIHVLMGPNGSGKSTLAQAIMGNPVYTVDSGQIVFNSDDITGMEPNERALKGIFLSFQYPSEISGVTVSSFLRLVYNKSHNVNLPPVKFKKVLAEKMQLLGMDESFATRYLNEGFSGGEKKRMEMLQMLVIEPKLTVLDETDSGLDVDALKIIANAVNKLKKETKMSVLLITHYTRILKYIEPDIVSIMQDGVVRKSGGKELAHELEEKGFAPFGE